MKEEIVELQEDVSSSPLYSADLAPVSKKNRTWNVWNLTAIWVGMAVCIPTYILASYMMKSGLSWYAALIIIGLANIIITIPMILNGHAGVKYGIPFPVLGRASFGTKGVHIASIVRAIVACGWFGVQTWIGGLAFYAIWKIITGGEYESGLDTSKFICFFLFWIINIYFVWNGTESIRWLEDWSAPILILIGVLLIIWGTYKTNGFTEVLEQSAQLENPTALLTYSEKEDKLLLHLNPLKDLNGQYKVDAYQLIIPSKNGNVPAETKSAWKVFKNPEIAINLSEFPSVDKENLIKGEKKIQIQLKRSTEKNDENDSKDIFKYSSKIDVFINKNTDEKFSGKMWSYILWLTAMVGFWATMSISIADITRYAATQKAQICGQFLGLPGTMVLYSFAGIFVTCASIVIFNDILINEDAPWDPVTLLAKLENPWVAVFAQIAMIIATLTTNIAANVIAPANAFANIIPKHLNFRAGGVVTGIIGIVICPWWLLNEISNILIFISGLLGPVVAILICDYYVIRKTNIELAELYKPNGKYSYGGSGFNSNALISLSAGVLTAIIGFWIPQFNVLYNLSWFTGFAVSFIVYYLLMRKTSV